MAAVAIAVATMSRARGHTGFEAPAMTMSATMAQAKAPDWAMARREASAVCGSAIRISGSATQPTIAAPISGPVRLAIWKIGLIT